MICGDTHEASLPVRHVEDFTDVADLELQHKAELLAFRKLGDPSSYEKDG